MARGWSAPPLLPPPNITDIVTTAITKTTTAATMIRALRSKRGFAGSERTGITFC